MADTHRLLDGLVRVVRQLTSRYDYAVLYAATVVAQNDDGSLELRPDTDAFGPGLSDVAIRYGVPGVAAKVKPGALVMLGFVNADPQRPYALVTDPAALTELTLTAEGVVKLTSPAVELTAAAGPPVARKGDLVAIGGGPPVPNPQTAIMGVITLGAPGATAPAMQGAPLPFTLNIGPLPAYGAITSGNPNVKA